MPISVRPGSMSGGTDFSSIALPAIAQGVVGILQGKEMARQKAFEDLSRLITLHGPGAVNLPQFNDLYQTAFGKPWPTEQVDMPAITEKQQVPVSKTMPVQGKYGEVAAGPSEAARVRGAMGEQGTGIQMMPQKEVTGTEEQDVEVSPARTETRPLPLGGATDPMLSQLGIKLPNGMDMRVSQAKALGLDMDKLLFPDPKTKDQVEAGVLSKWMGGKPLTPQEGAYLQNMMTTEPKTFEHFMVQQIMAVGGDFTRLPEPWKSFASSWLQSQNKVNYEQQVMQKAITQGVQSLNSAEYAIWEKTTYTPPNRPPKETLGDLRVQYAKDPVFRAQVDRDPALKSLILGTAVGFDIKQAQTELAKAEAAFAAARAELKAAEQALRQRFPKAEGPADFARIRPDKTAGVPDWNVAFGKAQAAMAARDAWAARVKELQTTPSQAPSGQGVPVDALPDAGGQVVGTIAYDSVTGVPLFVVKQDPKTRKNYWESVGQ